MAPLLRASSLLLLTIVMGCTVSEDEAATGEDAPIVSARATSTQTLRFACSAEQAAADPQMFSLFRRTDGSDEVQIKAFWGPDARGAFSQLDVLGRRARSGTFTSFVAIDPLRSKPGAPVTLPKPSGQGENLVGARLELDERALFITGDPFEGYRTDAPSGVVFLTDARGVKAKYVCEMSARSGT